MRVKVLAFFILIAGIATGAFVGYLLRPNDYVVWHKALPTYGIGFESAQVFGLHNKEIETTVNASLASLFENVDIDHGLLEAWPPEVLLQNQQCLSVRNTFWYVNNSDRFITMSLYQTISLKTGQELQLGNILNVNEDFVNYLMESPTAIKTVTALGGNENSDEETREYIKSEIGAEGIMNYLQKANVPYSSENYYDKCTFFLLPGEINIVHDNNAGSPLGYFGIRLEFSDIQPYLKIPVE